MKANAYDVSVDAGLIIIADKSWFDTYKDLIPEDSLYSKIEVDNGNYTVNWKIDDTWNGTVYGTGFLKVASGSVIVSDPCYWFDDGWINILNNTKDFTTEDSWVLLDSMGGDGCYDVGIELIERKENLRWD